MAESDWDHLRRPGHFFSRIARGLNRIGDARLKDLGFATAQLPVLSMLQDGAKLSQAELARWTRVEQPSMAQLLGRMERDGLITREPDPRDRRSALISLTQKAAEGLPAGRAMLHEANAEMTKGFSDAEVDLLLSLLKRVLDNVEAMEASTMVPPS